MSTIQILTPPSHLVHLSELNVVSLHQRLNMICCRDELHGRTKLSMPSNDLDTFKISHVLRKFKLIKVSQKDEPLRAYIHDYCSKGNRTHETVDGQRTTCESTRLYMTTSKTENACNRFGCYCPGG